MENQDERLIVFEKEGYRYTVLGNNPGTVNEVNKRIEVAAAPECSAHFGGIKGLKTLTMPEGVVYVKEFNFAGCINLEEVNMPKTVVNIGFGAFNNCSKLNKLQIPESALNAIGGADNFFENLNLRRDVKINVLNMSIIGDKAFRNRKDLKRVTIPEGVTEIDVEAFAGCSN